MNTTIADLLRHAKQCVLRIAWWTSMVLCWAGCMITLDMLSERAPDSQDTYLQQSWPIEISNGVYSMRKSWDAKGTPEDFTLGATSGSTILTSLA